VRTLVTAVLRYPSFHAYLTRETVPRCLPAYGVSSVRDGVRVYRKYYTAAEERAHGVLALRLQRV
jgi:ASC-1-like (ASCH) protein